LKTQINPSRTVGQSEKLTFQIVYAIYLLLPHLSVDKKCIYHSRVKMPARLLSDVLVTSLLPMLSGKGGRVTGHPKHPPRQNARRKRDIFTF